jgi:hypothetical protein
VFKNNNKNSDPTLRMHLRAMLKEKLCYAYYHLISYFVFLSACFLGWGSCIDRSKCQICDHLNTEDTELCENCGSLREESSYDIKSELEDEE